MSLDELSEKTLAELKRKRGTIKASLTRVRTFVENFDPTEQAISLLEFRQEELPLINRKFDEIQCQIELIAIDDSEGAELERDRFEHNYFEVRSHMQEIINHAKPTSTVGHNVSYGNTSFLNRTQLAPIPLPRFNGNIQDWASYFDIFKALVHHDEGYSAAQKFYFLRSSLDGPALDLVRSTPICDVNYEAVIQLLIQRYDNQSLVIQSHIRSILDCPHVDDSPTATLQNLFACVTTHVAALKALNQPVEHWDAWLITIITTRLDKSTAQGWLLHQRNNDLPRFSELEKFLASRCAAQEASESFIKKTVTPSATSSNKNISHSGKKALFVANESEPCSCCSGTHRLFYCEKFKDMSVTDRLTFIRKSGRCFNCLSSRHTSNICKSFYSCRKCKGKHNTLLHLERGRDQDKDNHVPTQPIKVKETVPETSPNTSASAAHISAAPGHVFLATAIVHVQDKLGRLHECRAVLDSGSQINFVTKNLSNLLQLPRRKSSLPICGIGANQVQAAACIDLGIQSKTSDFKVDLTCYVLPSIVSDLSACPTPEEGWRIPEELSSQLADPEFYKRRPVDLLIGGGIFFDILGVERRSFNLETLWLQDSQLGWIVTGELRATCLAGVNSFGASLETDWKALHLGEDTTYGRLSKPNSKILEEKEVVQHFQDTAIRNADGRFVLRLPIKMNVDKLGDSITMATSRFLSVERRLQKDPYLRTEYIKFMQEYLEMGHMQEVLNETSIPSNSYYLPHHAVQKTSSLTTKVRVVFDASARSSSGISLNDILMRGPIVQEELFAILTRFRKHQHVVTSDIEKMFRQIAIAEPDWDLQRILWRNYPNESLRTYRLVTVTYGTTPASYMTTQCLVKLAEEFREYYPKASAVITQDFYMDDLMTGCDTEAECCRLQQEVSMILNSAKLPLRKWCSNSQAVLQCISRKEQDPLFTLNISDDDSVKSLGLCWKPIADEFHFQLTTVPESYKLTKRTLLSQLNRIFDPLGFLAPVLIRGKIFLQQMWATKMDWDTVLPIEMGTKWIDFYHSLEQLKNCPIPRKVIPRPANEWEIHGFCDASEEAYGACIYVRSRDKDDQWHARLLCAKTRVAPLKGATIPRLELNGALLLADLIQKISNSWKIDMHQFQLWTDSMVVLSWLNSQGIRLKTYVQNRVEQILELTETKQWHHVLSEENPADMISRGIPAVELKDARLWWHGPNWLVTESSTWKKSENLIEEQELPEQRPIKLALITTTPLDELFKHYSSWRRLVNAIAWLSRFVSYIKLKRTMNFPSYLTVPELKNAETIILKQVQSECFSKEITTLKKQNEVPRNSKLRNLCPFLHDGLLLVRGRLQNAIIPAQQKHPIVIPAAHRIVRLIFEDRHREFLHCGPQSLLAEVRRRFWPLKGRLMARSVTLKCVRCVKSKPTFSQPLMAPLPQARVQCSRPFTVTGVDFAGPLIIRSGLRRVAGSKAWISIFVCFSTRAVHLEVVEDLTSNAFVAALRRFMSRRGRCLKIYSDNGTNFVGAQKELNAAIDKSIPVLASDGIEWHFNPPSAPHFGGLWESAVKSAKSHLTKMMGEAKLTLGELTTLLC